MLPRANWARSVTSSVSSSLTRATSSCTSVRTDFVVVWSGSLGANESSSVYARQFFVQQLPGNEFVVDQYNANAASPAVATNGPGSSAGSGESASSSCWAEPSVLSVTRICDPNVPPPSDDCREKTPQS